MRDFIGHEALINNFKQRCLKNTLSHAHLIAGEDGVGKGKLANILAKFILNGDLDREYVDIINCRIMSNNRIRLLLTKGRLWCNIMSRVTKEKGEI